MVKRPHPGWEEVRAAGRTPAQATGNHINDQCDSPPSPPLPRRGLPVAGGSPVRQSLALWWRPKISRAIGYASEPLFAKYTFLPSWAPSYRIWVEIFGWPPSLGFCRSWFECRCWPFPDSWPCHWHSSSTWTLCLYLWSWGHQSPERLLLPLPKFLSPSHEDVHLRPCAPVEQTARCPLLFYQKKMPWSLETGLKVGWGHEGLILDTAFTGH